MGVCKSKSPRLVSVLSCLIDIYLDLEHLASLGGFKSIFTLPMGSNVVTVIHVEAIPVPNSTFHCQVETKQQSGLSTPDLDH